MTYQLNPFQAVATADWDTFLPCGTMATRPYDYFEYYRIIGTGLGGNAAPWRSTALYYPAAQTIDYDNPVPWQLYIPRATINFQRRLPWPGRIEFCLSGTGAIGGGVGTYEHIVKATEATIPYGHWAINYNGINGPGCAIARTSESQEIVPFYEFTDNLNATVADYRWPGISNV
jgi:hypothetical protein